MKKAKEIPQENLYIALLDDDPDSSCRPHYLYSFVADYKIPDKNVFITDNINKFITYANKHKLAVLFCDPGALGDTSAYFADFKADRMMAKWLEDNPSRILNVPFLISLDYYSFRTFELKHSVYCFGTEFQWEINQIMFEWLFEHNPLALFIDIFAMYTARVHYIEKLKGPVLTKICEKFGLKRKTITDRKKAINDYYTKIFREEMKKRGY